MNLEDLVVTDQKLGAGGFGSVFMGQLGEKKVAAKKLSQSESKIDNLMREASKLKRLRHGKYIAYIYDITLKDRNLYLIMEYSERGDLQNYLEKNKESVTNEQKILFCRGILLGLLYCHSMSIFHGNIKCSNVILGKNLEPKLTDFGLSMTVDNIEGYCKTYEGSIHWTAPELFSMEEENSFEEFKEFKKFKANPYPTDVYSLGATFCEISYDGTTESIGSDNIKMDISLGFVSPTPRDIFLGKIVVRCCQFERDKRISLGDCLFMLDVAIEKQLPIPVISDKWQGMQQDIKASSKLELPPSFILHRPTENLVIGPSNLSLLEWLCISDFKDAVEYMIGLHILEQKQLEWLYNISTLCKSPDTAEFLYSILQNSIVMSLRISDLIDENPWKFIESLIRAGADCGDYNLIKKAVEKHCNELVQLIVDNGTSLESGVVFNAIKSGNAEAIRILAVSKINLECKDENGDTPLLVAINTGNVEAVQALLELEVNIRDMDHCDLLHKAAARSNHKIVRLLVGAGVAVNLESKAWYLLTQRLKKQGKSGMIQVILDTLNKIDSKPAEKSTPLCTAIRNRQSDLVQKFIDDGVDANEHGYDKYSPLHCAVIIGDEEIVRTLLNAGAEVDTKTPNEEQNFYIPSSPNYFNGYTPLHIAVVKRHLSIAKLLIESRADFSLRNTAGQTIMDIADDDDKTRIESIIQERISVTEDSFQWVLEAMSMEAVKVLISSKSASMNTLNHFLCIAACHGNTEAVNYLLEYGVNVNSKYEGKSPLEWAIFGGHTLIVQILIGHGAEINAKSTNCRALLFECVDKSLVDMVWFLIKKGADINARNERGYTPIHFVKDKEVAKFLISHGADINARSISGRTPLIECVNSLRIDMVQFLIEKGANVNARTEDGFAPIHYIKNREIAEILISHSIDINARSVSGRTPLIECVIDSLIDMVQFLTEKGADVDIRDEDGFAPIYYAKNREIAEFLVSNGADINARSISGVTPLFGYVEKSLIDIVQFLIENGVDINAREEDGYTPIHSVKDRKVTEILIAHGADVNVKSTNGGTPLFGCVEESLVDIVQFLIEKGADVNARDKDGYTPIHSVKDRKVTEILIAHGADVNARSISGKTPLFGCVEKSLIDMVQFLIENGADVNTRTKDGFAPIHFIKDREIAEILIAHGADINTKSTNGMTPLFECVNKSLVDIVQFLIEKGADVNARDEDDNTLIHFVKDREIAKILIAHGADVNARSISGRTPLFEYVDKSLVDMVQFLIEKGADINARIEDGFTPIYYIKNREIAEFLISHGADINARSISGRTPLIECVIDSLIDMVQFLIEEEADVNARDEDGFAPIHYIKDKQIAEILIIHGADINAKSANGVTVLFGCVEKSLTDMVQFLIEKGADVNARDKDGYTPIHSVKDKKVTEILIAHGADVNVKSTNGMTPLFECVKESLVDIVQFLIEKGADVNAKDKDGNLPIHYTDDKEIMEILINTGTDINAKDRDGRTLLTKNTYELNTEIVRFLVRKGADVNIRDKYGFAPIHCVKDRQIAEILIAHGADANKEDQKGRLPILEAVKTRNIDMIQLFIDHGIDPKRKGRCFYNGN